jgi:TatD DNase family protein
MVNCTYGRVNDQNMKYFDIHSHLNFSAYKDDREATIERMQHVQVSTITVGTQIDTSKSAVALAEKYAGIFATVGTHPIHTSASHHDEAELGENGKEFTSRGEIPDMQAYTALAKHPKVVAIGEVGLDYYHHDEKLAAAQVTVFEAMIDLANEVNKPLMLHIRNGAAQAGSTNKSAYRDAFEILKSRAKVLGNLHFFAGTIEEAKLFLDLGYTFSFTGVVTFARNYDEVIKYIPLDRIMSETDAPYVTPAPYRGKRNEPAYVVEVVKKLAEIKGVTVEIMAEQIRENVRKSFNV